MIDFSCTSNKELFDSAIRDLNEEKSILDNSDNDSDVTMLVLCTCWNLINCLQESIL